MFGIVVLRLLVDADILLSQFMYRCVTSMTDAAASGCIMADEMGLGKTVRGWESETRHYADAFGSSNVSLCCGLYSSNHPSPENPQYRNA